MKKIRMTLQDASIDERYGRVNLRFHGPREKTSVGNHDSLYTRIPAKDAEHWRVGASYDVEVTAAKKGKRRA